MRKNASVSRQGQTVSRKLSFAAYLLKEDFQFFWDYVSPYWAGQFLDRWCTKTMRSRLEPLKAVARSLRKHREILLNYFRAKKAFSSGIVEGFNNKLKLTTRTAYGYRSLHLAQVALYHALGDLPEPESIHKFCRRGKLMIPIEFEYLPGTRAAL